MNPTEGYRRARTILKEQFGNQFEIAQAWIDKVTQETIVKTSEFRKFANILRTCYKTLKAGHCLVEIEAQSNLNKIIDRLPGYAQNQWRTKAAKIKRKEERLPGIKDAEYIETVTYEASDPVFGVTGQTSTQHTKTKRTPSFNISMETTHRCAICSKDHATTNCIELRYLEYLQRLEMFKTKGLCFKCLEKGHVARDCEKEVQCDVSGCKKRHATLLHRESEYPNKEPLVKEIGAKIAQMMIKA